MERVSSTPLLSCTFYGSDYNDYVLVANSPALFCIIAPSTLRIQSLQTTRLSLFFGDTGLELHGSTTYDKHIFHSCFLYLKIVIV